MQGKLYLCATPIGNLEDITLRVLRTLKEVDLIAAEDTRNSIKLLNHFEIKTPMTSYHEYNKIDKAYYLIEQMKDGKNVALITDAGTPGISDPGEDLVRLCYEAGIEVTSLPGPAACVTALTLSGLSTRRFCFEAFLPSDKKEKQVILEELKEESRTIILYEAPHRLVRTLEELLETLGLYEHQRKFPNQLSGGQQQRTAIGRAIVKNPDILLCDEPTGALDYNTSKEILKLIQEVNQKYGNTVIMVTHNDAIKNMADRVIKLRDGQIRKNYVNETKISAEDLDW